MKLHEFETYIKSVPPSQKEKADAWQVAFGLQAVDGLKPSAYMLELACKEIEGKITMDDVERLIRAYHEQKRKSRDMGLTPQVTPQARTNTHQVQVDLNKNTPQVDEVTPQVTLQVEVLVKVLAHQQLSVQEMMEELQLKDRKNFRQLYLVPALESGYIRYLYPDKPRHPRQRYLLTVKGLMRYEEMMNKI